MKPELFGVFERLAERLGVVEFESYYGPTMSEFTRESAWDQVWDIAALRELLPPKPSSHIIDLGTGDGRIIKRLTDLGVEAQFLGVDNSPAARDQFNRRQAATGFPGEFVLGDFLDGWRPDELADAVIFGSVSINGLHTIGLLSRLFSAAREMLAADGLLILSAYTDESTLGFPKLDGVLDCVPYQTVDGNTRLMWRGLQYTGTAFRHNAFIDRAAEGLPSVICWERERVWSESELCDVAFANGWTMRQRSVSSVPDGGANGFEVATISFVAGA